MRIKDLTEKAALERYNDRIIEDIPEASLESEVILVKQEKKFGAITRGRSPVR